MSDVLQDEGMAELVRQQSAQAFELPETPIFDDVGEAPPFSLGIEDDDASRPRERKHARTDIQTLEDLYAAYPDVGKGEWKIRIGRLEPKAFRGQHIAGFICELYERISIGEFQQRFGGGVYQVGVMRPTHVNEGTMADFKSVRELKFRVAGDPKVSGEGQSMATVENSGMNTQVESQRLQIEARERERLHIERQRAEEKAERIQREIVPSFYEQTKRVVEDSQSLSKAQVDFWKGECERVRDELQLVRKDAQKDLDEKDGEIRRLNDQIISLRQQATATTLANESRAVTDLRATYDSRILELKEQAQTQLSELRERGNEERQRMLTEHTQKLQYLAEEHRKAMAELTARYDLDRRNFESAQTAERERIREDSRYRIDQANASKDAELRSMRETYEQRINDLRLSTDREIQSLRDMTAREIESIRQSERAQATLARESAEMKREAAKSEEARVRQEIADLRRENTELRDRLDQERAKQHKDPLTAIREIREMGAELGLVDSADIEKPEKEESTMQQFLGLARQAFDSAPQIMEKIAQSRKEQADAQLQAQQMHMQQLQAQRAQAQQQAQLNAQRAPRQLAPSPQASPVAAQPRQSAASRYAPPQQAARPTPPPFGGSAYQPPSNPVPFAPTPNVVASPLQSASAEARPLETSEPVATEEPAAMIQAPSAGEASQLTEESGQLIVTFFTKLEGAVANKVLSPETFAIGVINEVGAERTAQLLGQFSPKDIVDTAQMMSEDSAIATRDGQKFVNELWRIATAKVAEQGFPVG